MGASFDRIEHSHLLARLGTFPARGRIEQWLKAGVLDQGRLAPTERGCPQGGVISPVLMNVVLHGMEHAAGVRYITTGSNAGTARPGSPVCMPTRILIGPSSRPAIASLTAATASGAEEKA